MYRSEHTYKRVVIGILAALVAVVSGTAPSAAQTQLNLNTTTQNTTATGIGTGGSATATGGSVVGSGNSESISGVVGSGNSDNLNKNKNDNNLVNDPSTSLSVSSVGSPNLIQLPGLLGAYPNFTQPFIPPVWLNGASVVIPNELTYAQAKSCRGDATGDDKRKIKLYYVREQKIAQQPDFAQYTGDYWIETKDEPYMKALCKAATKAMDDGAGVGVVSSIVKPKNKTTGVMLGASFGGSGMPAGGANPYALAGVLGGGVGWSNTEVEGKLMIQLTGFKDNTVLRTSEGKMLNTQPSAAVKVESLSGSITPVKLIVPGPQGGE